MSKMQKCSRCGGDYFPDSGEIYHKPWCPDLISSPKAIQPQASSAPRGLGEEEG